MRHPPARGAAAMPPAIFTCWHNYLLRVRGGPKGPCYVVQDLCTGERHQLASDDELRQFLASHRPVQRLR